MVEARRRQVERTRRAGPEAWNEFTPLNLRTATAGVGRWGEDLLGTAWSRDEIEDGRGEARTLRVARTLADLGGREGIEVADLVEAVTFGRVVAAGWVPEALGRERGRRGA